MRTTVKNSLNTLALAAGLALCSNAAVAAADYPTPEDLPFGQMTRVEASGHPEDDAYSFSGKAGEQVRFWASFRDIEATVTVYGSNGAPITSDTDNWRPGVDLFLPTDGQYVARVQSKQTFEYIVSLEHMRSFDSTGRSKLLMYANDEWGPYGWLVGKSYRIADGTVLRWHYGDGGDLTKIVEEQARDGKLVATHVITNVKGSLLMDGAVRGVIARGGDSVEWHPEGPGARRYAVSLLTDERLRWETMAEGAAPAVDKTEYFSPAE